MTSEFAGKPDGAGYYAGPKARAGWRYGLVAVTDERKSLYGEMQASAAGTIRFTPPENVSLSRLWLVVMGAPTEHRMNPQPGEKDAQWPCRIRVSGSEPLYF